MSSTRKTTGAITTEYDHIDNKPYIPSPPLTPMDKEHDAVIIPGIEDTVLIGEHLPTPTSKEKPIQTVEPPATPSKSLATEATSEPAPVPEEKIFISVTGDVTSTSSVPVIGEIKQLQPPNSIPTAIIPEKKSSKENNRNLLSTHSAILKMQYAALQPHLSNDLYRLFTTPHKRTAARPRPTTIQPENPSLSPTKT